MSTTATLVDLASETNKIVLDAVVASNRRSIAFAKSVWGVVARPLTDVSDFQAGVGETFERVEQVVDLTVAELETASKSAVELAEHLVAQAGKAREESLEAARSLAKSGIVNLKHALEATEERLDDLSKRLDESVAEAAPAKKAAKA